MHKIILRNLGELLYKIHTLADKDLRDTPCSILEDHLYATDAKADVKEVLAPRIATEMLTPYRTYLQKALSAELAAQIKAALRKNTPDQKLADEYLYQIRHRANPNNTKITATIDLIKKERRKELVMEGHRLYDILRVGDTVERKGGTHFLNGEDLITVNWNDYRTIMPIPQAEIDANPQIKQNPSY